MFKASWDPRSGVEHIWRPMFGQCPTARIMGYRGGRGGARGAWVGWRSGSSVAMVQGGLAGVGGVIGSVAGWGDMVRNSWAGLPGGGGAP